MPYSEEYKDQKIKERAHWAFDDIKPTKEDLVKKDIRQGIQSTEIV